MSINKYISTLPDTKRTLDDSVNYSYTSGLFVTKKQFSFSDVLDIKDVEWWQELIEAGSLIPLHYIKEIEYEDEETIYKDSLQDFPIKLRNGKRGKKVKFSWTIEKHELVDQLSGTDLYVIEYDRNNNVYLVREGNYYRGMKTSLLELEKMIQATETTPAFSPLKIKYQESFTDIVNSGFMLTDIDRLFMSINIEYIDNRTLNFSAYYQSTPLNGSDILQSDITVTDSINGVLTADLFNYSNGVFQLKNFNKNLITGKMEILSTLYLGCVSYIVRVIAEPIIANFDLEDGVNLDFEDLINFEFEN